MERVALVPWVLMSLTAGLLAVLWAARGGLRRQDRVLAECFPSMASAEVDHPLEGKEGIPLYMVMMVLQMSIGGLILWLGVIGNGELGDAGLPWVAVSLAAAICGTAAAMVHRLRAARANGEAGFPGERLPKALVGLFVISAALTLVLVTAAAAGIGD